LVTRHPSTTPIEEWSDGWLLLEVASILDNPFYITLSEQERAEMRLPASREQRQEYVIRARKTPGLVR
jgi:hypothetical protein